MARVATLGIAVLFLLSVAACKPAAAPSDADGPDERPAAAPANDQAETPPPSNWEPRKRNVQPSKAALVKTEDVIEEGKTKKPNILVLWGTTSVSGTSALTTWA